MSLEPRDQTGDVTANGGDSHKTTRKVQSLITPDGEASVSFDKWIGHFESVAKVNGWDDATSSLWLEVRMTGKAQNAWRRLTQEAKAQNATAESALCKRFEPDSRWELYAV